jgi:hypothetical protein
VPCAKIARFFSTAFGLPISGSILCRALARLATRAGPTDGADYAGVLGRNGWAPCRAFEAADDQTCLLLLLRRTHGLIEILAPASARRPQPLRI